MLILHIPLFLPSHSPSRPINFFSKLFRSPLTHLLSKTCNTAPPFPPSTLSPNPKPQDVFPFLFSGCFPREVPLPFLVRSCPFSLNMCVLLFLAPSRAFLSEPFCLGSLFFSLSSPLFEFPCALLSSSEPACFLLLLFPPLVFFEIGVAPPAFSFPLLSSSFFFP